MPNCPFKKEIYKCGNKIQEDFRDCDCSYCMAWVPSDDETDKGQCALIYSSAIHNTASSIMLTKERGIDD